MKLLTPFTILSIFLLLPTVLAVPPTLMNLRDITEDIEAVEPEDNQVAPISPVPPPEVPLFVEFTSNDGMNLRIATETLLDKHAGPLDAKIRYRESMQTTTFVDVPGCLLRAMLNYYRYGVLICPPEDKLDPAICQLAMNEFLPGVQAKTPSARKSVEILFSARYFLFHQATIVAPLEMMIWIESVINQLGISAQPERTSINHNIETRIWKLSGYYIEDGRTIHAALIKNAPDRYRVSTVCSSLNEKEYIGMQVTLRVEDLES